MIAVDRILICAMPRTGTTKLQIDLSGLLKLENFNEPYHVFNLRTDQGLEQWYQWLKQYSQGIVKLLSTVLETLDFDRVLDAANFDHVVFIDRSNITDCCLSLYYAQVVVKKYHWSRNQDPTLEKFICPESWVRNWIMCYHLYQNFRKRVIDRGIPHTQLSYETFMADSPQYVLGVEVRTNRLQQVQNETYYEAKFISYRDLCDNYQEVKRMLEEALC